MFVDLLEVHKIAFRAFGENQIQPVKWNRVSAIPHCSIIHIIAKVNKTQPKNIRLHNNIKRYLDH